MGRLAILAGQGDLPRLIAAQRPDALYVTLEGIAVDLPANERLETSYERFGEMFAGLRAAGVTEVVFAGSLARPILNPANFDAKMTELAPFFHAAMQGGDDGLLGTVITAFEMEGFLVSGAHEFLPKATAHAGHLGGPKPDEERFFRDAQKAWSVVLALSFEDVGQAAVASQGVVLGVETLQGTDAMLNFVAGTDLRLHAGGGVLFKGPKAGQDLRIDMPAIGPSTIRNAALARLSGVAIAADKVLILDRKETIRAANESQITLAAINV